jgi:hypothetical protein
MRRNLNLEHLLIGEIPQRGSNLGLSTSKPKFEPHWQQNLADTETELPQLLQYILLPQNQRFTPREKNTPKK